jgi:hypothetical protein
LSRGRKMARKTAGKMAGKIPAPALTL